MEPHSRYLVLLANPETEVSWNAPGEGMFESGFHQSAVKKGPATFNALLIARTGATSPGFPFLVALTAKTDAPVRFAGAMRIVARDKFADVPVVFLAPS